MLSHTLTAQSHIDQSATFTDGVLDCDGARIEGDTTIGTVSANRTLTVNGTIASTGAITQGGTAVTLSTHRHLFTGIQQTASVSFSNKSGATTFLTPTTSTAGTLPTWSASVSSETLSFSFSAGNFPVYSSQGVANTLSGSVTFTPDGDVGAQYYPS